MEEHEALPGADLGCTQPGIEETHEPVGISSEGRCSDHTERFIRIGSRVDEDVMEDGEEQSQYFVIPDGESTDGVLKKLPNIHVDQSGTVSSVGCQIVLGPGYHGYQDAEGLFDLPSGSQIVVCQTSEQSEDQAEVTASAELVSGSVQASNDLSKAVFQSLSQVEVQDPSLVEQSLQARSPDTQLVHFVNSSSSISEKLPSGEKLMVSNDPTAEAVTVTHIEGGPDGDRFSSLNECRQSKTDSDDGAPRLVSTPTDPIQAAVCEGNSVIDSSRKHDWKWFRDSGGRKPSKFTCKVFDAVIATVSPSLLKSVKSNIDTENFPNNCALLEHLLVTKHHVTDLMIREDRDELQLAGDLIDIMEVHNVLLGNLTEGSTCAHKPLHACSAVMKDQGVMCTGVPPPTGRGGRKLKKIYTRDMHYHVPVTDDPALTSDPDSTGPAPEITPTPGGARKSGRIRRPPIKMEDHPDPIKKRRGRKPYRRTKALAPAAPAADDEAEHKDAEAGDVKKTEVVTEQEVSTITVNSSQRDTPMLDPVQNVTNLASNMEPSDSEEVTLSGVDPVVIRSEMLTGPIELLPDIKPNMDAVGSQLPLASAPLTTQTVDSFLPIITAQDAQSEDEQLFNSHGDTLVESQGEIQAAETDVVASTTALPVDAGTSKKDSKRQKKKDYEAEAPYKYFCKECSFKTKRESHFHKHSLLHTEKNLPVLKCSKCNYSTLHLSHLRHHQVLHTPNALKCVMCPYKTISIQQMKKHHRIKHEMKSSLMQLAFEQKCIHCDYKTDKLHLYQRHMQCHVHVSGNKTGMNGMLIKEYSCTHCSYTTNKKENFLRHVDNVHSTSRPYLCDLCGMGFKRKDTLKNHRQVHLDKAQRTYKYFCPKCNKGLRSKGHLDEHMSMHSNKREYLCEICGTSFKTRGIQRRHVFTIHKNPKAYTCLMCNKPFNTKFALQRHNRIHEIADLQKKDSLGDLVPEGTLTDDSKTNVTDMTSFVEVTPGGDTVNLPLGSIEQSQIIQIQPMSFQDQGLGTDQVITELQVLPMESSLEEQGMAAGQHQEASAIAETLDGQKMEVQIQPTLVQTSTGPTTLLYLTAVPQELTPTE